MKSSDYHLESSKKGSQDYKKEISEYSLKNTEMVTQTVTELCKIPVNVISPQGLIYFANLYL